MDYGRAVNEKYRTGSEEGIKHYIQGMPGGGNVPAGKNVYLKKKNIHIDISSAICYKRYQKPLKKSKYFGLSLSQRAAAGGKRYKELEGMGF